MDRRTLLVKRAGVLLGALIVLGGVGLGAQGPFPAQIEAALRAFLTQPHTWTATQTFADVVVTGSCTGCGGGGGTPGGADTQVQFNDAGVFGGDTGAVWNKTNNVLTLTTIAGAAGSNQQTLTIKGVNAASLVGVGDGVDPAAIVSLKSPTAVNGGGAQFGVISTDYSTDPSDAFVMSQDGGGASTIGVGFGANWQHVSFARFDPRTASNDAAIGFFPNGGVSPSVLISRAGNLSVSGDIASGGDFLVSDGKALKTDTTTGHTALLQAYDVNGAAYVSACTLTNANAPSFNCAPSGDLTIDFTANDLHLTGSSQTITGSEVSTPSAPAANGFKMFAKDSGGGKTQVCVLFNSGAAQCFATEP